MGNFDMTGTEEMLEPTMMKATSSNTEDAPVKSVKTDESKTTKKIIQQKVMTLPSVKDVDLKSAKTAHRQTSKTTSTSDSVAASTVTSKKSVKTKEEQTPSSGFKSGFKGRKVTLTKKSRSLAVVKEQKKLRRVSASVHATNPYYVLILFCF